MLDYYGRRLATCSSDRTIKIFTIDGDTHTLNTTLKGHEAPVWSVAWAHPKFGSILASCAFDGKVVIWREASPGSGWSRAADFALHSASVNAVSWAPHELGALLACASSDGSVSVLGFADGPQGAQSQTPGAPPGWDHSVFPAHELGCNAVSWAPALLPGALEKAATAGNTTQAATRRFATGGSDCAVKIWEFQGGAYTEIATLRGHEDWVRDVAWSPSLLSKTYVASASQDKSVRIWTLVAGADANVASNWKCATLSFECVVWRCSWSLSGNVLAVSGGDNKVSLWKERVRDGGWECVKTMDE